MMINCHDSFCPYPFAAQFQHNVNVIIIFKEAMEANNMFVV